MREFMPKRTIVVLYLLVAFGCGYGLLRSRPLSEIMMTEAKHTDRFLRGFYELQQNWRWTSRVFAVSLDPPHIDRATYLELDCNIPLEIMSEFRTVTLTASVNGVEVGKQTFYKEGHYYFTRYVPVQALKRKPAVVEFELDRTATEAKTGRTLGMVITSIGLKEYERTAEYRETQMWIARQGFQKAVEARNLQLPPAKQQELMRLFVQLPAWQNLRFHNIQTFQNPLDLWMVQQIIYEVQPDFIVATGASYGGAALYMANALNGMGLQRSCILTVDAKNLTVEAAKDPLWKKHVEFLQGDSTDPEVVSRIAGRIKGRSAIVILGSDHAMQHVLDELRLYSPLVSRGSYLIVEATYLDGLPAQTNFGPGPYEAVRRFLEEGGNKTFDKDLSREMMVLTFNPGGWLRRK
jgi:cephalosporin hydroxylase